MDTKRISFDYLAIYCNELQRIKHFENIAASFLWNRYIYIYIYIYKTSNGLKILKGKTKYRNCSKLLY